MFGHLSNKYNARFPSKLGHILKHSKLFVLDVSYSQIKLSDKCS